MRRTAVILVVGACLVWGAFHFGAGHLSKAVLGVDIHRFEDKNQHLVTDSLGAKSLILRWARTSGQDVGVLKVPFAYVDSITLATCLSFDASEQEACTLNFEPDLYLTAQVPELAPATKTDSVRGDPTTAHIHLQSIFYGNQINSGPERMRSTAEIARDMIDISAHQVHLVYGVSMHARLVEKPGNYGLRRLGLIHNLPPDDAGSLSDIYFSGDEPETSSDIIVCMDSAVPTLLDDPHGRHVPHCLQTFFDRSLSAIVEVRYQRQYLRDWNAIRERTLSLLQSFEQR